MKIDKINRIGFTFKEKLMWAATMLTLLLTFSISLFYGNNTYKNMVSRGKWFVSERSDSMNHKIMETLTAKFELLDYIAALPEIQSMDTEKQMEYLKGKASLTDFQYLFIVDMDGNSHYVTGSKRLARHNEAFFDAVLKNYRYVDDPYTVPGTDEPITTICVSIYDKDGEKVGALCGTLSLYKLYKNISSMYDEGISAAITHTGEYVLYEDVKYVIKKDNALETYSDSPEIVSFIEKSFHTNETLSDVVTYKGSVYFVALSDLEYCHWKVIYILEDYFVMNGVWSLFSLQIFAMIMMIVAVVLIFRHQCNAIKTKTMAYQDQLTGLGNAQKCQEMLSTFNDYEENIMFVCFDLNRFKQINDTYGHQVGDEALVAFADCLKHSFGVVGFVGRIGGDEFISLISGEVREKLDGALELLNKNIDEYNAREDIQYHLSVSYGYSIRTAEEAHAKSIHAMYYEADKSMYKLKEKYHNGEIS